MADVFNISGESDNNVVVPAPLLQGLFIPGIDNSLATDGFGIVTPWGGGGTARKYSDYGISGDISRQSTQLNDLASSLIPAEGAGVTYNWEGLVGPQGIPGRDGRDGIIHIMGLNLPQNSNFLAALPHNIDQINDLGTAIDKLIYTSEYNTYTEFIWTDRQPTGDENKNWQCMASDSDGSHLIAAVGGTGRLYTSADSGVSWTERQPAGDANQAWFGVASDSDGSHLIAGIYNNRLYTSANYGVSWTERQPKGDVNGNWHCMASDSDGSNLIVGEYPFRLYTSANYGVSWTERQPAGDNNKYWGSVASDSDGSHLIAGIYGVYGVGDRLYTSADSGVSWTERQPAGDNNMMWRGVASDSDGSNLIAVARDGGVYTSANYGVSWTERFPAGVGTKNWRGVASDSDGSHLAAVIYGGRIYVSSDSGVTWAEEQPAGDVNKNWFGIASDSDGSNLMTAAYSGRVYTGVNTELYSEATWAEAALTSAGRAILDDANASDQATTLGLGTGDSPTWTGATLSGLTASRLIGLNASNTVESVTIGTGLNYTRPTLSLSHLGIEALTDPGGDRIIFWDDSETACRWLTPNTLISITGTNLNVDNDLHNYDWTNVDGTDLKVGTITQAHGDVLDDLNTLGAVGADNEVLIGTAAGVLAWESGDTLRTSIGLAIGTDIQAHGDVLDDLNTLGANSADGEFLVGTGAGALAWESGATARTSIGLGTADNPTFAALTVTSINSIYAQLIATDNLSVGDVDTMSSITTGDINTVMGSEAGESITSGDSNCLFGYRAGRGVSTTDRNTVVGTDALYHNTTSSYSVMMGWQAGWWQQSGDANVYIGAQAGLSIRTGQWNTFIGYKAGYGGGVVSGTADGTTADHLIDSTETFLTDGIVKVGMTINNDTDSTSAEITGVADGDLTLDDDIFVSGEEYTIITTQGQWNVAIGPSALLALTSGNYNVCIGDDAGERIQDGDANFCLGNDAGENIVDGGHNICIGPDAGDEIVGGNYNIFVGTESGGGSGDISYSTCLGHYSGNAAAGNSCVCLGYSAGRFNTSADRFIVDDRNRTDEATEITNAILYGVMAAAPASQTLAINAATTITGTLTGTSTATFEGASVTVGKASTTTGTLVLHDSNSANTITLTVPDISAGSLSFTLPATDGDNTNVLQTNGSGVLSWVAAGGASTWIGLTDTDPANYTDEAGNCVIVNAGEDGLTFGAAPGGTFTSKCSVYRDNAQAIATSTSTKIQFDTEDYDVDGEFDSAVNYRFQPDVAGYYHVSGVADVASLGADKRTLTMIYKNGVQWKAASFGAVEASYTEVQISCDMYLLDTDYVELWIWHNHGGDRNVGEIGRRTFLDVHRFG